MLHSRLVWKISTGESGHPCLLLGVGTIVKVYIFTVVYIWQSVISALNKGYHLSRDYVVTNEDYNTCNKIHHIQCLRQTEVRLHVLIKEKQNRDELQFLSSDT